MSHFRNSPLMGFASRAACVAAFCLGFSGSVMAVSADTTTITTVFTGNGGGLAIKVANSFASAVANSECPTANGYAGVLAPVPKELTANVMLAKATGASVIVITSGCTGNWFNLQAVYVQ